MFKRLHFQSRTDKKNQKEADTYKKIYNGKTALQKKTNSYFEKYKNKTLPFNTKGNQSAPQIFQTQTYLFQGNINPLNDKYQKHGEGVLFSKSGMMIIGVWDHGLLEGDALIFSPFGGQTLAQFSKGKLNGWVITKISDKLVTFNVFYNDSIDGQKIVYEHSQQLWVASKYCSQLNSYQITHAEKGKRNQLPSFLKVSYQLQEKFYQFVKNQNLFVQFQEIKNITITGALSYIGYSNQDLQPQGLGIIFSKNEFYMGNFQQGSLQKYGRMLFQNGQIYHGELTNGVFSGEGVYYNPNKNMSTIMQTSLSQKHQKAQQIQGYVAISVDLNCFATLKRKDNQVKSKSLQTILQTIQKYYFHYYIQKGQLMQGGSVEQEFGISQKNQDQIQSYQKINIGHRRKQSSNNSKLFLKDQNNGLMQKKWLDLKNQQNSDISENQFPKLERQFSLDKRDRNRNMTEIRNHQDNYSPALKPNHHKNLNIQNSQSSLDLQFNKIGRFDRNLSLKQKYKPNQSVVLNHKINQYESIPVKQNVDPQQRQSYKRRTPQYSDGHLKSFIKKNTVGGTNLNDFQHSLKTGNSLDSAKNNFENINSSQLQIEYQDKFRKYSHSIDQSKSLNSSEVSKMSQKVNKLQERQTNNRRKKIFI